MLTVKYINGDGEESLTEHKHVIADRTDSGAPRVLVFDETPNHDKCNHSGIYVDDQRRSSNGLVQGPTLYVMNRFGATVATYRLARDVREQPTELAA